MSEYKNDLDDITELKEETEETEEGVETVNEDKPLGTTRDKISLAVFLAMIAMIALFFVTGSTAPLVIAGVCFVSLFFLPKGGRRMDIHEEQRMNLFKDDDSSITHPSHPSHHIRGDHLGRR